MDEKDVNLTEEELGFTLEDIIREFGSGGDAELIHDDVTPELMEDVPQRELVEDIPVDEQPPAAGEPDVLIWTPGSHTVQPEMVSSDTVRVDTRRVRARIPESALSDDTRAFAPVQEQGPAQPAVEPFSAGWEPQYDQPIGEYVPPEPIIFRPRSRLGELKRKLVEGPERRYHALSEKGVGKLQIALFTCMLIVVLAVVSIVLHRLDMVRENRMRLLIFGEFFAMLICALLCWERLTDGLGSIFKGKFTVDTLLTISFIACVIDGVYCLQQVRVPFSAAFCLECLMLLWSEYQGRSTELFQMDTLRKATRLNRVAKAPDCTGGQSGFGVTDGQPEDFMDTYKKTTAPGAWLNRFALIALLASIGVGVAAGLGGGLQTGIRTWCAAILAACPATMLISQTRPAWTLQRKLYRFGAVICGWEGVKAAAGKAAVPLGDEDLLPGGSVKSNGVRYYSSRNPDTILGYTTAVMTAGGSCLAPLFEQMHDSLRGQHFEVDEFKAYSDIGYGAVICGEQVLVGTRQFLKDMGIELRGETREEHGVYVAIDGEFSCVIALTFGKLKGVSAGLNALCGQRGLTPVMATTNFILSEKFLRGKYRVDTRRITFPEIAERERLSGWRPQEGEVCALTTQEGLAGAAFSICGARALRTASNAGAAVHILGGVVGLAAVLVLTLTGRADLLNPANLLLLELVWAVPGLMISEWTRNI